jgi:hypothetical protein
MVVVVVGLDRGTINIEHPIARMLRDQSTLTLLERLQLIIVLIVFVAIAVITCGRLELLLLTSVDPLGVDIDRFEEIYTYTAGVNNNNNNNLY